MGYYREKNDFKKDFNEFIRFLLIHQDGKFFLAWLAILLAFVLLFIFSFLWFLFSIKINPQLLDYLLFISECLLLMIFASVGYFLIHTFIVKLHKSQKKRFFTTQICNSLENEMLKDFDELLILFESISVIEKTDPSFDQSLDEYLNYAIAALYESEEKSEQTQDSVSKKRNLIEQIKAYKALNLKKNPNLYLPDFERQLFESITESLNNKNTDRVREKLSELSGAVKTVHENVAKNTTMTKWSYGLTIAGFIVAIILGLLQLPQIFVWYFQHIFNLVK
jgi:hypothetical protein